MKRRHCIVALVCLASAVGRAAAQRPDSSAAPQPERHRLDLDGDGVSDEVTVWPTPNPDGAGAYNRVELKLSRAGTHSLTGNWDKLRDGDASVVGNAIKSRLIFVGRLRHGGALLVLFGEDVGCCAQGIDVYRITKAGVAPYFSRSQFSTIQPLDLRAAVPLLVGQESQSETAGTSAPDAMVAGTYDPVFVYRFEARPRLDSAASVRATSEALGGFAGFASRIDVMSVMRKDRSRYLWDEANKRRIP